MPELISMLLPKKKDDKSNVEITPDAPKWPYGLKVTFEKEQIDLMPSLIDLKVGDRVMLHGEACVIEVRITEEQSEPEHHTISLQIEKIAVEPVVKKKIEEMTMKEYKKMRESER